MLKVIKAWIERREDRIARQVRRAELLNEGNAIVETMRFNRLRAIPVPAAWDERLGAILLELETLR